MFHENRRLTDQEVAYEVVISIVSCHRILTEKFCAKLVLNFLTDDQKENSIETNQEIFLKIS